ncbi:MAG TPA: hypothetical protein VMU92_03995 [Acidobacteriaceae bacterium]|nr:hypothetical protein [Acidobacteriaceae bacterium]
MRVEMDIDPRKFIGPCMLLAGWVILIVAVVALSSLGARTALILFGLLIELIGFAFFVIHRSQPSGERN